MTSSRYATGRVCQVVAGDSVRCTKMASMHEKTVAQVSVVAHAKWSLTQVLLYHIIEILFSCRNMFCLNYFSWEIIHVICVHTYLSIGGKGIASTSASTLYVLNSLNTLRPRSNGRHFAQDIFKCISCMKIFEFRLKFLWSLFLRVQLTILQHWLR